MLTLGIETSCDETAVALVSRSSDGKGNVVAANLLSQTDHSQWGGVVPELAARNHLKFLPSLIKKTLEGKTLGEKTLGGKTLEGKTLGKLNFSHIDLVSVGCGPGLVGGLLVGSNLAKGIAIGANLPFMAVNHLQAHSLVVRLETKCEFPYVTLLASGGHCLFAVVKSPTEFQQIGSTIDDAAGEAFDKTARLLGLGFPGGAELEKLAAKGDPNKYALPQPLKGKPNCDFSFSGLKTAVRRLLEKHNNISTEPTFRADVAAAFQQAMVDILTERTNNALKHSMSLAKITNLVFCGGVAANKALRNALAQTAQANGIGFLAPSASLCTDNAIMIGWCGLEMASCGKASTPLAVEATSRLSIESNFSHRI